MNRANSIEVLAKIEPAIELLQVLGVVMPVSVGLERSATVTVAQIQLRHPGVRSDAQRSNAGLMRLCDGSVERGVGLSKRVIVAERQKRVSSNVAGTCGLVLDDDGLFALDEKDFLLQASPADVEGPDRKRIEPK